MRSAHLSLMAAFAATLFAAPALAGQVYIPSVREVSGWRTMNSRHFLLANGTYNAEVHQEPINYRAKDGTWQPIDTAIAATAIPGFAAVNDSNVLKSYLPAMADGWIRVEAGDTAVSFRPLGVRASMSAIGAKGISCANAWNQTDLAYTIAPGQLKETLTLTAPDAPRSFRFGVRLEGFHYVPNSDKSVSLLNADGSELLTIEAPWMVDAAGRYSSDVSVAVNQAGDELEYAITPNPGWLATARYPVTIDPTVTFTASKAVVRKSAPNSMYSPGVNSSGTASGSYLACGALSSSEAYRTVLGYNVSLPLDSDINLATINLSFDHATYPTGSSVTVKPYALPSSLNWTNGITWTNVGSGVPSGDSDQDTTITTWGTTYTLDVSNIVQGWADRRPGRLNVLLRDVNDDGTPTGNVMFFGTTSGLNVLTINYTPGWYTFQGNRRRTGRTQNWIMNGLGATDYTVTQTSLTTLGGPDPDPDLPPSLVAIPDPNNGSAFYPIVYAAISGRRGQGITTRSRVYRFNTSGNSIYCNLTNIQLTGTPVALGNTLIVTGNEVDSNGDLVRGHLIRLDASPSNNPTSLSVTWDRPLSEYASYILSSPLFSPFTTQYTVRDANWVDHTTYNYDGTILVSATIGSTTEGSGTGYMFAKSLSTGYDVWGTVDEANNLIEYPPALVFPSTHSSPSMTRTEAFTNDYSCYVNARNIVNGEATWSFAPTDDTVEGTISLFSDRILYGGTAGSAVGAVENSSHDGASTDWLMTSGLSPVWTTFAYDRTNDSAIFADDGGRVYSVGAHSSYVPYPNINWTATLASGYAIRASPLVAGDGHIYVPTDDHWVHVLNPSDNGAELGVIGAPEDDDGDWIVFPFYGKVRASIAPYGFGFFVLTTGAYPTLYRITQNQQ